MPNVFELAGAVNWNTFTVVPVTALAIVNGLFLLRQYLTDRPRLVIQPVHFDAYLWWCRLEDGVCEKGKTRNYALVAYLGIANVGNKPVGVIKTRLRLRLRNFRTLESPLYNINEPVLELANGQTKVLPVFQQKTQNYDYVDAIKPGVSTSGITCFHFGFFGAESWSPRISNKKIKGRVSMKDVYGKTYYAKITFSECHPEVFKSIFPNIEVIGKAKDETFEAILK